MADSTVRLTNMPDSGSQERVAYDLTMYLKNHIPTAPDGAERIGKVLAVYAACLKVVKGHQPDVSGIK